MNWVTEPERKTPVVGEVDLLVCGGGFAGVAAAVCAARLGAKVMLLERPRLWSSPPPLWITGSTWKLAAG